MKPHGFCEFLGLTHMNENYIYMIYDVFKQSSITFLNQKYWDFDGRYTWWIIPRIVSRFLLPTISGTGRVDVLLEVGVN